MSDFDDFIDGFYPYRKETTTYRRIPDEPRERAEVLAEISAMAKREDAIGDEGKVSGSLYSGDHEHYGYLGEVFSAVLPRQRAAAGHVPVGHEVRG